MRVVSVDDKMDFDQEQSHRIEFLNSIGIIFFEYILLPNYKCRVPIYFKSIEKIKLVKKNSHIVNSLCLVLAMLSFVLFFYSKTYLEIASVLTLCLVFLYASFSVNKSKYRLVIVQSNLNFIELSIDKNYKAEAKNIVRLVERKLKHQKKSSF
ncbi:MAG: hypothetical protein KBC56_03980 [Flavobacterium sp.]|nr:hypothetical protein [Flavobacterium sp.]